MKKEKPGPKVIMCRCGKHARIETGDGRFFAEVCSKEAALRHLEASALDGCRDLSLCDSGIVRELVQEIDLPERECDVSPELIFKVAAITLVTLASGDKVSPVEAHAMLHAENKDIPKPPKPKAYAKAPCFRKRHKFR